MPHDPLLLATAVEAVLVAGDIQLAHFGSAFRIEKKGEIDLVTEVDLEVERMFRSMIEDRFPDHRVLAEELQSDEASKAIDAPCWIFDPIDGTTNYAHGLPIFCATVALEIDGQLEIGAVYDPTRRELYTAERNGGAFLNGVPLKVSREPTMKDALLCTGFPYDVHTTVSDLMALFGAFVGRARAVRRLGSAALDLCYVACGRFDGFWEQRLKPWDMAAAVLLVQEAGGQVTAFDGGPFQLRSGEIVASNGPLHQQMIDTILDAGVTRSRNGTI